MDIATEYLFGESSESLLPRPRIDITRFSAAVEKALKGVQRRVVLRPLLPFLPENREWRHAYSEVDELFDQYIDRALADRKAPISATETFQDQPRTEPSFTMLRELVKESQDRHFLRNQLLTVFLPMYQAAPFGLSDIFFQLARSPNTWLKLRAEVLELGDTPLTFESLSSMTYLQCVIKESEILAGSLELSRTLYTDWCERSPPTCASRSNSTYLYSGLCTSMWRWHIW